MPKRFTQWRHECLRLIARILRSVGLHHIQRITTSDGQFLQKTRTLLARLLIQPGNLFLYATGSDFFVLPTNVWLRWEQAIDDATGRQLIVNRGNGLWSRIVVGRSLRDLLRDSSLADKQKLDAIVLSLVALHQLHQHEADWEDGLRQSISHGDATADNVIVDLDTGTACWIDFDTRHSHRLSELDRRADDLRCLIYSAAIEMPQSCWSDMARLLADSAFDTPTLKHLQKNLVKSGLYLNVAQLAQAPLPWEAAVQLRRTLVEVLDTTDN